MRLNYFEKCKHMFLFQIIQHFYIFLCFYVQTKNSGLNNAITNIDVYVDDDGALHYVDKDGADSVLPFNTKNYLYKCGDTSFRDIVSNIVSGTSSNFSFEENYLKMYTYGNGTISFDVDVTDINYIYFDFLVNDRARGISINYTSIGYFSYSILDVSSYTGVITISFNGNGQESKCRNIYGVKELQ